MRVHHVQQIVFFDKLAEVVVIFQAVPQAVNLFAQGGFVVNLIRGQSVRTRRFRRQSDPT